MKINGAKVKEAREASNVSRSALAEVAALTSARIWQIETSDVSHVNDNIVRAMAKSLGVSPEALQE